MRTCCVQVCVAVLCAYRAGAFSLGECGTELASLQTTKQTSERGYFMRVRAAVMINQRKDLIRSSVSNIYKFDIILKEKKKGEAWRGKNLLQILVGHIGPASTQPEKSES